MKIGKKNTHHNDRLLRSELPRQVGAFISLEMNTDIPVFDRFHSLHTDHTVCANGASDAVGLSRKKDHLLFFHVAALYEHKKNGLTFFETFAFV